MLIRALVEKGRYKSFEQLHPHRDRPVVGTAVSTNQPYRKMLEFCKATFGNTSNGVLSSMHSCIRDVVVGSFMNIIKLF